MTEFSGLRQFFEKFLELIAPCEACLRILIFSISFIYDFLKPEVLQT